MIFYFQKDMLLYYKKNCQYSIIITTLLEMDAQIAKLIQDILV